MPSTKNFEWDVEELLGEGTYGRVYKVSEIPSMSFLIQHNTFEGYHKLITPRTTQSF